MKSLKRKGRKRKIFELKWLLLNLRQKIINLLIWVKPINLCLKLSDQLKVMNIFTKINKPILILLLIFSSCKSEINVSLKNYDSDQEMEIHDFFIQNNQIVISGVNLDSVNQIHIEGEAGFAESFSIESSSSTQVVANSLRNITFIIGRIFNVLISSAHGASNFTINFAPENGSDVGDFKADGTIPMEANINMNSFRVTNSSGFDVMGDLSNILTGTVDITGGTNNLIGTGTNFTTELKVGDAIKVGNEVFTVAVITNDTDLDLDSNHLSGATGVTASSDSTILSISSGDNQPFLQLLGNGNLGVGNNNPIYKLSVNTADDLEDLAAFYNSSNHGIRFYSRGNSQVPGIGMYSSGSNARLLINPPSGCCNAARIIASNNIVLNPGSPNAWAGVGFPNAADPTAKWEIDGTGGTLDLFKISSHADVNTQGDILIVENDGDVGIGTPTPSEKLHVIGNLRVEGSTDCILGDGAGATNCSSDLRLKTNIKRIEDPIKKLQQIDGISFNWNLKARKPGKASIGVAAQQVQKQFPTAVVKNPENGYLMVDYAVLVAPLIEAVKAQQDEISKLKRNNFFLKKAFCERNPQSRVCE